MGPLDRYISAYDKTQWLRPKYITDDYNCDDPWTVMDNPTTNDIQQGKVGDCWYINTVLRSQ